MATGSKAPTSIFVCTACGTVERKWHGQCPGCGDWNTLVEEAAPAPASGVGAKRGLSSAPAARRAAAVSGGAVSGGAVSGSAVSARSGGARAAAVEPVVLSEVRAARIRRIATGIGEFDRVLGTSSSGQAGLVPGSLVLLGGSPGIGKSTLLGAALANLVAGGSSVLYVSGEESPEQIRMRHERLGEAALHVPVVAETDLDTVLATIDALEPAPDVVVIDSVQTLYCNDLSGAPGSVGQVREVAARLMQEAKGRGIAMVLVGHVTKEGALAGPRVLEHLVDCVLQFEGERERSFRTLRAAKNRFGSTNEIGVFEMEQSGLVEIADASARFVGEATGDPGSVVFCAIEGTRPMLVEIQALVSPTEIVPPRRVANGIDRNRLALALAVLARHAGLALSGHDVFVNVVGGVRIDEPAADLAVALAVASAARNEPLTTAGTPLACFGELGLTGELRPVGQPDRRAAEAAKFGLDRVLVPASKSRRTDELSTERIGAGPVTTIREALSRVFVAASAAGVSRA